MTSPPAPVASSNAHLLTPAARVTGVLLCGAFLGFAALNTLPWTQQALLAALTVTVATVLQSGFPSRRATLCLVLLSCYSTLRYGLWRVLTVSLFVRGSRTHLASPEAFFAVLLLCAELYSFLTLGLGYFQSLTPMRRSPAPLPADAALWPEVDVLITTLDEPLHLVKYTALAARNMDWPADRLNIHLLDDGRREEFRSFCFQAGIGYMVRDDLQHAKAGNINRALERLSAPLVAFFDADQVPTRSFLQTTAGWFLRDPKLGLLQTPHRLYSQDSFERNLPLTRRLPPEDELFYRVVQDGNDLWNAAYFCGSCALMRRAALDDVGGIAVETVTEDVHTSLLMQKKGWNTAYLNLPLAAGPATERLSAHIRQRVGWARGMVQVLRLENPLFARGLTWSQRLCYFHAMAHLLYPLPRLTFLTLPLLYLCFGLNVLPGGWAAILAYAVPHLVLLFLTNARLQGLYRQSFWNEIYETVLAPYLLLPTFVALLFPRADPFHVPAKGTVVERSFFDMRIGWPFLLLLAANLAGLAAGTLRLVALGHGLALAANGILHGHTQPGMVCLNLLWTVFNLVLVSVAIGTARERQQRRRAVRLARVLPAEVLLPGGDVLRADTADVSTGGAQLRLQAPVALRPGDPVSLIFPSAEPRARLPATVVTANAAELRLRFYALTLREEETLATILFSRADSWIEPNYEQPPDSLPRSLLRVSGLAIRGLAAAFTNVLTASPERKQRSISAPSTLLAWVVLLAGGWWFAQAELSKAPIPRSTASNAQPGATQQRSQRLAQVHRAERTITLDGLPLVLNQQNPSATLRFSIPETEVVRTASLTLSLRVSPKPEVTGARLRVLLNGMPVDDLPLATAVVPDTRNLTLPPELLVHNSELTFELAATQNTCAMNACTVPATEIEGNSTLHLTCDVISPHRNPAPPPPTRVPLLSRNTFRSVAPILRRGCGLWLGAGAVLCCFLLAGPLESSLQNRVRRRLHR